MAVEGSDGDSEPLAQGAGMMGGTTRMAADDSLELYRDAAFVRRMARGVAGEGAIEDVWQEAWREVLERWDVRGCVWTVARRMAGRARRGGLAFGRGARRARGGAQEPRGGADAARGSVPAHARSTWHDLGAWTHWQSERAEAVLTRAAEPGRTDDI